MPRAYDRRQLPVDRDPLKQLDTNYGKLPKLVLPGFRDGLKNALKQILGIDFNDNMPFLTWLFQRPFFTDLINKIRNARLLAQQRIRAGTNLVSDPSIDNPEFWQQYSTEQVGASVVTPYVGNHALKMTSLGVNPVRCYFNTDSDGAVDPIKTRRGDVFIVEAHVFAPTTNATGTVQLVGKVKNSRTGVSQETVIDYKQLNGAYRGQWQKVSGTFEVPAGFDQFSAGLLLPEDETIQGNVFFGDQFVIREVTDTHRLFALSGLFARRGSNLLLDPNVEDPLFWVQPQAEQVGTDIIQPSSGSTALQITASGGNNTDVFFNTAFNGLVEPITARVGELFAVEARVLSPTVNTAGTISLIAKFENSRSGATTTTVVDSAMFDVDTQGSWQPMIGYARIPLGYNRISVGIRLPAGQIGEGQHVYADELVMRETSAVRRLFDVLRLRSRRGGNLVTDSQIEDAEFWTQPSITQVGTDVVTPSSGSTALQVTSRGATATDVFFNTAPDGSIEPINARKSEYYEVSARILSPSTNSTGNVSLIARFENSRTGASTDTVIETKQFDSAARGSWQLVSGFVKVPSGYNRISLGMRLPANQTASGQHYYADELVIHEATATQRLKEILRLRIRRGSNLVTDPTFDDPEFWVQESTAIVDYQTVIPASGNQSLQITSRGATATPVYFNTGPDGTVEPIKVRHSETYEIAAFIYSPGTNTNGVVSLTAQVSNSRTGNTDDITITTFAFTSTYENQWILVNGFVKIPVGFNHLSAGILLGANDTLTGDVYYVNEALIRESTAAKRLLDMSRQRIRHGVNLLSDANFEDAELWTKQESVAQVGTVVVGSTTVTPRTGNYSLQVTSRGATATTALFNTAYDGSVEPVRARGGEHYYLECYVLSPASNSPATVKLIARLANSKTGAAEDVVVDTQSFDTLTEDTWQPLSGYVKIPVNRNLISAGITLDANQTTLNNPFFVDDALLKEVTGAQRITDALFDGFNGTTGSFGKNADDVLGSMDGVKDGERALRLARQRAKVGPNFVNDPRIEDTSYWVGQTGVARSEAYARNGGSSLQVTCGATGATYAWWNVIDGGQVQPLATWEGDALYVQCWYYAPTQPGGGTVQLVVKSINTATNASIETVLKTVTVAEAGSWKKISGTYTMPEGADGFSAGVKVSATGLTGSQTYNVYFDALMIREQTAAQRLFNVSKLRTRAGNNLVGDPNFDDAEFWTQDSIARADSTTLTPRTGSYSLQITSQGATPTVAFFNTALDGSVEPIKTRLNERFYVECYVYSPAANDNATIKLIARLMNTKTATTSDVTLATFNFTTLTEGVWQKLSGYARVTAGFNLISAGVLLDANQSSTGNVFFVDDALIREVTGSQRLVDVLFDGFNGTTGSFGKDPDEVYGSMGFLGDGTKGLSLARQRAKAGANFVNDPRVEQFGYWTQPSSGRSADFQRNGQYSLKVTSRGATPTYCWWTTLDNGDVQPLSTWEDDRIHAQCWVYSPVQTGSGSVKLVARASNSFTAAYVESVLDTLTVVEGSWTKLTGIYTVPQGADSLTVGILIDANAAPTGYTMYFDSLSIREATVAQRVIDNLHQALTGGTGTNKSTSDVKTAMQGLTGLARRRARSGTNLVVDPKIDTASASSFWTLMGNTQVAVSTTQKRSGSQSLAVTLPAGLSASFDMAIDDQGATAPITAQNDDIFYVEGWFYTTTTGNTVTIAGKWCKSSDPTQFQTPTLTGTGTLSTTLATNTWTKLAGYFTIPAEGNAGTGTYDSFLPTITVTGTTSGRIVYADDMVIREVTVGKNASTENQTFIDRLHEAMNGGTASGRTAAEVKTLFQNHAALNRGRQKAGSNLVTDPKINNSTLWSNYAAKLTPTTALTLNSSAPIQGTGQNLKVTIPAALSFSFDWTLDDQSNVSPVIAEDGDVLYVECMAYGPAGSTFTLYYKEAVSSTGATATATTIPIILTSTTVTNTVTMGSTSGFTANTWKKLSGRFIVPDGTAYDSLVIGITVGGTLNQVVYLDHLVVREITATQNVIDAIQQASAGGTGGSATLNDRTTVRTGLLGLFNLGRGRSKAGSNLLVDPKVETASASSLWTTYATKASLPLAVSTTAKRTGAQSLAVTVPAGGTTTFNMTIDDQGVTAPLTAQNDDIFYVEFWAYSASTPVTVTLSGRWTRASDLAYSAITGTTTDTLSSVVSTNVASWTKFSGYFTVPATGTTYDSFVAAVTVTGTSGQIAYIDDMLVREVTEAQGAAAAASGAAQSTQDAIDGLWNGMNGTPATRYGSTVYTQSSVYSGTSAATYTYMNNGSAMPTGNQAGTNNDATAFIKADVGASRYVNYIVIGYDYTSTLPGGWTTADTAGASVQGSTDNTNWTTISTVPSYASTGSTNGLYTITIGGTYRYIRLMKSSAYLCTLEFQVWTGGTTSSATGKSPSDIQAAVSTVKNTADVADVKALTADNLAIVTAAQGGIVISPDFEEPSVRRFINYSTAGLFTGEYSTTRSVTGTYSYKITMTGTGASGDSGGLMLNPYKSAWDVVWFNVAPGQVYNYDFVYYLAMSSSKGIALSGGYRMLDGNTSSSGEINIALPTTTKNAWQRATGTITIPALVPAGTGSPPLQMALQIGFTNGNVGAANDAIYIDRCLVWR